MKLLHALAAVSLTCASALPCTGFLVVGDGRVLFGNNEDYWNPETRVWFVPAEGERRGVMYVGFDNGFPQGGMNDAGLAFDGFATGEKPLTQQDGKRAFAGNPISEAMETCTTVEEVVAFLGSVDLSMLSRAMLFFADATGDSVIIEGDAFLRKEGDFQVVTNFYQSAHDDDLAQCNRYAAAVDVLENRRETSVEVCARALSASAQRGRRVASLYSNVFDLEARTAHLYLLYDFETPVVLDLAEELAQGERTLRLPDLFPPSPAYEEYTARQAKSLEQRIAERLDPNTTPEELTDYEGEYRFENAGETFDLSLRSDGEKLIANSAAFTQTDGELVFYPEAPDAFFMISQNGELDASFHRDEEGAVVGFTIASGGWEIEVTRVESL